MTKVPKSDALHIVVQVDRAEAFYGLGLANIAKWEATKRLE